MSVVGRVGLGLWHDIFLGGGFRLGGQALTKTLMVEELTRIITAHHKKASQNEL